MSSHQPFNTSPSVAPASLASVPFGAGVAGTATTAAAAVAGAAAAAEVRAKTSLV